MSMSSAVLPDAPHRPHIERFDLESQGEVMYIICGYGAGRTTITMPAALATPETEACMRQWVTQIVPACCRRAHLKLVEPTTPPDPSPPA